MSLEHREPLAESSFPAEHDGAAGEFARAMSRELHDNIAQSVAATLTRMETGVHYLERGDATAARVKYDEALEIARQALAMTKRLAVQARTFSAADVSQRREPVENSATCPHRAASRDETVLCDELFLVLREAVHNALTHSGAEDIAIWLTVDRERATATVQDNGTGFSHERLDSPMSLGLRSMYERVQLLGGTVALTSQRSAGTRVHLSLPLAGTRPC